MFGCQPAMSEATSSPRPEPSAPSPTATQRKGLPGSGVVPGETEKLRPLAKGVVTPLAIVAVVVASYVSSSTSLARTRSVPVVSSCRSVRQVIV